MIKLIKTLIFGKNYELNKQIRASVRTVHVPKNIRDRTLAEVLNNPLSFPKLKMSNKCDICNKDLGSKYCSLYGKDYCLDCAEKAKIYKGVRPKQTRPMAATH